DRRTYPRRARRIDFWHRGQLDRRAKPEGGTRKSPAGRGGAAGRFLDRRRGRLDRGAVFREAPADAAGGPGGRTAKSRLHPASLRLGLVVTQGDGDAEYSWR